MRRWVKGVLISLGALAVIGLGFYYYLFHLHGLEDIAASKLNSLLAKSYPVEISIGHIGGNGYSELVLDNVSVRFKDGPIQYQCFGAQRISAGFSLQGLLRANY